MPRPAHRPTKYKPKMCEQAIELMAKGYSLHSVALELGIDVSNMRVWAKEKPDFRAAINRGKELSQGWWERLAVEHVVGNRDQDGEKIDFNTTLWFMNMKNRFKEDWRDKHDVEVSGDMTVKIVRFTPENKDGEPWAK